MEAVGTTPAEEFVTENVLAVFPVAGGTLMKYWIIIFVVLVAPS